MRLRRSRRSSPSQRQSAKEQRAPNKQLRVWRSDLEISKGRELTGSGFPRGTSLVYGEVLFRMVRGMLDFRKLKLLAILVDVGEGGYVPNIEWHGVMRDIPSGVRLGTNAIGCGEVVKYGVRIEPFLVPAYESAEDVAIVLAGLQRCEEGNPLVAVWIPPKRTQCKRGFAVTVRCKTAIFDFQPNVVYYEPEEPERIGRSDG